MSFQVLDGPNILSSTEVSASIGFSYTISRHVLLTKSHTSLAGEFIRIFNRRGDYQGKTSPDREGRRETPARLKSSAVFKYVDGKLAVAQCDKC